MDESFLDAKWRQSFRRRLLKWYRANARDLPWRNTHDPYRIWISEIMLQQTQVETVKPYYGRFLKTFPNVRKLAAAKETQVLRLWEGLGYYRRARQLHAAAKQIVAEHKGKFPDTFEAVQALPGIGRYTAGAILSFAHDQQLPIVEANTLRLYSRLLAMHEDPRRRSGQDRLWEFAAAILPRTKCGEANQALIELGSQICRPKEPLCETCPVVANCAAFRDGCVEAVPMKAGKTNYENVTEAAVVIRHQGHVLLRQCQATERWAGLWDFPRCRVELKQNAARKREIATTLQDLIGHGVRVGELIATMDHAVTRFRISLLCYEGELFHSDKVLSPSQEWVSLDELEEYPLSVTGRKLSRLLLSA